MLLQDFRSKDGLYSLIQDQEVLPSFFRSRAPTPSQDFSDYGLPSSSQDSVSSSTSSRSKLKGQDLFDASVWKNPSNTAVFYRFIASLRQRIHEEVKETSPTHKFIRTLRDGGRLMRCYTQNIDGLESREGLIMDLSRGKGSKRRFVKTVYEAPRPSDPIRRGSEFDGGCEVVPLHGDLDLLRCSLCQDLCAWDEHGRMECFLGGEAPQCGKCEAKNQNRRDSGKRGLSVGLLRPNIVLYQEEHPSNALLSPLPPFDIGQKPEVLLIMGTSLKVHGLQKLIREFSRSIHTRKGMKGKVVLVNRTKPAESLWNEYIDEWICMDCDDWVKDLRSRREDLWLRQGELPILPVTKPAKRAMKAKSMKASKQDRTSADRLGKSNEGASKEVMTSVTIVHVQHPDRLQTPPSSKHRPANPQESSLLTPPPSREESIHGPVAKYDKAASPQPSLPSPSKKRKLGVYEDHCDSGSQATPDISTVTGKALKRRSTASKNVMDTSKKLRPEKAIEQANA